MKGREQREKVEEGGIKLGERKGERGENWGRGGRLELIFSTSCGKSCAVLLISPSRIFFTFIGGSWQQEKKKKVRYLFPSENPHLRKNPLSRNLSVLVQNLPDVARVGLPERSGLMVTTGAGFEKQPQRHPMMQLSETSRDAALWGWLCKQPANAA